MDDEGGLKRKRKKKLKDDSGYGDEWEEVSLDKKLKYDCKKVVIDDLEIVVMVENEEEMKSKEVEKEIFRKKKKYDCKK